MRQKCLKLLQMIWEKKWLLFLVLTLFYFGTAALLHSLYEREVFQKKTYYKEDVYSYHELKGNAWDYEVTFPDEKFYRFANGEDKYYSDVETGEQDPEYSPNLIRSALLAYKSYYDTDYLPESSVLKYTGFFWFLGIGFLCTRDFWMELELTKLSWRIEWQTTGSEFILEPSEWMRFSYLTGGVLVAAGAYIAMIGSYMHLR